MLGAVKPSSTISIFNLRHLSLEQASQPACVLMMGFGQTNYQLFCDGNKARLTYLVQWSGSFDLGNRFKIITCLIFLFTIFLSLH